MKVGWGTVGFSRFVDDGGTSLERALFLSSGLLVDSWELIKFALVEAGISIVFYFKMKEVNLAIINFDCAAV